MLDKKLIEEIEKAETCIFEFDGTIADTRGDHIKACENVLAQMNVKMNDTVRKKYRFMTDIQYFKAVIKDYKLNAKASECAENKKLLFADIVKRKGIRIFPWVKEAAPIIRNKRNLVLTSLSREELKEVFRKQELSDVFKNIWSLSEKGISKLSTIKELKDYHPIYFDDTGKYLSAAKASGLLTVGVTHSFNRDAVLDCDYIIDTTKR